MTYYKVFIDTNIYISSNYCFDSYYFKKLIDKANNDELELHINYVVEKETKHHITEDITDKIKNLSKACKAKELASFKKDSDYEKYFIIPEAKVWIERAYHKFENFLNSCNVKKLSDNNIDIESILNDHFALIKPFEEKKRNEFKDAITISTIIKEIKDLDENEIYCVVSNDNGFKEAIINKINNNPDVRIFSNLKDLISKELYLVDLEKLFEIDNNLITETIKNIINEKEIDIVDFPYEIFELNLKELKSEYEAIALDINTKTVNPLVTVAITANCEFNIFCSYRNEDLSYWDKEEESYLFEEIEEEELKYDKELKFIVIFEQLPNKSYRFKECIEAPEIIVLRAEE